MSRARIRRSAVTDVLAGLAVIGTIVASSGCQSSAPEPGPSAQAKQANIPVPSGSLPQVTVTADSSRPASADLTGHSWYVTTVRDPIRGSYTAAVESHSLSPPPSDAPYDATQRASIALVLQNGRPTDLVLSVDRGQFVCTGHDRDKACALQVAVDDAPARSVRFAIPRRWPATHLHLAGGDDARRLLATIPKAKHLRIQPTFQQEGSPELEFMLTGLNPAIAKLMRHSVAAAPKPVTTDPGA